MKLLHCFEDIASFLKGYFLLPHSVYRWQFGLVGDIICRINKVNQHRARLGFGWVTICRWVNHLSM